MTGRKSRPGRKRKDSAKPPPSGPRASNAPPPTPLQRGIRRGAIAAVAVFAIAALWLLIYPSGNGPGDGAVVEIVVNPSESGSALADRLAQAGLVASPRFFAFYLSISGGAESLVAGPHLLSDDASPRELLARLQRRPGAGHVRVTFPEGWTRFDMAKRLQEKKICALRGFLDATTNQALLKELRIDGDSAEGFLFPSTYELAPDSDPAEVVRRMKAEFDKRWLTLEQRYQSGMLDLTMPPLKFAVKDAVTLASMVEKEAAVDEERPIIASVFLNRMRDADFHPKLLQCDPTAGYGCLVQPDLASCAGYAGKITPQVNGDPDNRYTTYKHEGLPPGPISNPGAKSLAAVLAPAATRYLYFVARGEGRHTFSETYGSHTAAVRDGGKR
jgi:UPF0755 protein